METFEIRYFLAAAADQNIHKAAKALSVSPPAVSRAVSRLEGELGVKLFHRIGRNIELSPEGKKLQKEVSRVNNLLEDIRATFNPSKNSIPISICGTEFGLSAFLPDVVKHLRKSKILFSLDIRTVPNTKLVEELVLNREANLGIISGAQPSNTLSKISLGRLESRTLVGENHPLYERAKGKKKTTIEEVLKFEFVSFHQSIFGGSLGYMGSGDGWRDDKFPRRISLKTQSLGTALSAIASGLYLGYLPLGVVNNSSVQVLEVTGCPYSCKTDSFLLTLDPSELDWSRRVFGS